MVADAARRRARTNLPLYTRPVTTPGSSTNEVGGRTPEARLAAYAGGRFRRVPGFLNEVSAAMLVSIAEAQRRVSIEGPVAEIGVFAGRTTTLLYLLTQAPETVVGVDLFEAGTGAHGHPASSEKAVHATVRRFAGDASRLKTLKCDSGSLDPGALLRLSGGEHFRLFHIDGDHSGAGVQRDLVLALATLAARGVVVTDDVFNPNTPEVFEAVTDFVRETGALVPFATAATKMFLCRPDDAAFYLESVSALGTRFDRRTWHVLGADVSSFRQPARIRHAPGGRPELRGRMLRRARRGLKAARRRVHAVARRLPWQPR